MAPNKNKKGKPKKKKSAKPTAKKRSLKRSYAKTKSQKSLQALKQNQKRLLNALDSAHIGVWEWNVKTNTVEWSDNVFKIFGLSDKSLFGNNLESYISRVYSEDLENILETLHRTLEEKKDYYIEHRIVWPDGSVRWVECIGKSVCSRSNTLIKLVGSVQDITLKKTIEHEREDWKTRHELISAAAGLVIYDYDIPSGNIVWSGTIHEVLGYLPQEIGDINRWVQRIHPDDRDEAFKLLEIAEQELKPYDVYYRFSKKDNSYCYMHDRGFFLPNAKGKAVRMLGMMNDVTERKKIEQELIASEQRFRTLQQASFGGIGLHDKGIILDCNQGLCNITGYSYEELIGSNGLELIAPECRDMVREKILSGYEKPYDVEGLKKDGTRYFLEIHGKNIPYQGRTIRVTEFRNITERKESEAKILEQNARLVAITEDLKVKNEQLQEFTQIVSHNLRSPVGNILSLLSFFENADSNEERNEYLTLLRESSANILTTLHELNEVLQIKQHKDIERQTLHFAKVFNHVKRMFNAKIAEVGAEIIADFSDAPVIHYPNIYLESIYLNLLSNALKYRHPERQPVISFKTYLDKGDIILKVSDNGLGVNLNRYGHQIFKLRKTFHRHPESRGIGLFMIKNQIEAMGGEISVTSTENEGTTFFVNFTRNQHPSHEIEATDSSPGRR